MLTSTSAYAWSLGELVGKKNNSNNKEVQQSKSVNFIAFEDAKYNTSPDKRVGAKILVDTNKVGPSIAALTHLTYLPGAHITSHRHVYVTEIIYVLEGNLTIRIDKETKLLGPNSTAFIAPKTFHEIMNDSTDVVKFLQYYSPSGAEEEYRNWENDKTAEAQARAAEIAKEIERKNAGPEEIKSEPKGYIPGSPVDVELGDVKVIENDSDEEIKEKTGNNEPDKLSENTSAQELSEETKEAIKNRRNPKIQELLLDLKKSSENQKSKE